MSALPRPIPGAVSPLRLPHCAADDCAADAVLVHRQSRAPTAADVAVGLRIRALRRASGRTQKQLASQVGVTNAQLHRYEMGISRVAASRLMAIGRALEVRIEALVSDDLAGGTAPMPHAEEFASLARAFAAITDPKHRAALLSLAHTMAGASVAARPGDA